MPGVPAFGDGLCGSTVDGCAFSEPSDSIESETFSVSVVMKADRIIVCDASKLCPEKP